MILVRPAGPDDMALVLDSWARSFRLPARRARLGVLEVDSYVELGPKRALAPTVWSRALRGAIEALVARAAIAVAYHPTQPGVVVGWVAFEEQPEHAVLHYVWTRPETRRQGVARRLLTTVRELVGEERRLRASFMTHDGRALLRGVEP